MMVSAALALLMTPALGLFYGGMTRAKAILNMMMMSFTSAGIVGVVWVLWGYSMTVGSGVDGLFGNPFASFGLQNLIGTHDLVKAGFSATFAMITVALISGAIADRAKFSAWAAFVPAWVTLVYAPLAFMVWGGGLLGPDGALGSVFGPVIDFAGGTVVEISAGTAALVLALVLGPRHGFGKDPAHRPHNIPFVMLGAGLLWFGWFGFNAGAATTAEQAGLIWVNTLAAPAAALLGWVATEKVRDGHPTSLGAASGVVAGLVAITPACSSLSPVGSIIVGALAGVLCALAVGLKYRLGYDDSLDVVGVHLVGGLWGTIAIGFFATDAAPAGVSGLFYGGGVDQLWRQIVGALAVMVFSFALTWIIGTVIQKTMGFRISEEDEVAGIDTTAHAESAYDFTSLGGGSGSVLAQATGVATPVKSTEGVRA
jgi:ammonium transporter, Amt family